MPEENSNNQAVLAALFAIMTNWDEAEVRAGRRGEYRTTGANMFRLRELAGEERGRVEAACAAVGIGIESEEIDEMFNGDYEYQISFACNRFVSKGATVSGIRLTGNEMKAVERLRVIAEKKPQAVAELLGAAPRKRAA